MRLNVFHVGLILMVLMLMDGCSSETKKEDEVLLPPCVMPVFPTNGTLVPADSTILLSWYESARAHSYDIYLGAGTSEPTLLASDIATTTYAYTVPAEVDASYSWYVRPKDSDGAYLDCREYYTNSFKAQIIPAEDERRVVKVLVLSFDPEMSFGDGPGTKLHTFLSYHDPRALADGYIQDVLTSSDSMIQYEIVEWRELDEYPVKTDGFVYTDSTYFMCMFDGDKSDCHAPDGLDYYKMIHDHKIVEGINQDVFEEVWLFGAPYFGFWEAAMAGPKSFYINGGVYQQVPSKKAFAIMGFNYERGVAEMMHDLCHRTESTMSFVYGGWRAEQLTNSWAKFAANKFQSGEAGVGSCHFPPNAISDYDYNDVNKVMSSANNWLTYPILTGGNQKVGSQDWGGPDFQRNYLRWWFNHLPRRVGVAPDGKLNNWWNYIFDFNETIINK